MRLAMPQCLYDGAQPARQFSIRWKRQPIAKNRLEKLS